MKQEYTPKEIELIVKIQNLCNEIEENQDLASHLDILFRFPLFAFVEECYHGHISDLKGNIMHVDDFKEHLCKRIDKVWSDLACASDESLEGRHVHKKGDPT